MESIKRAYYYLFYKFYKISEASPSPLLSNFKAGAVIIILEVWTFLSLVNYFTVFIDRDFELNKAYAIIIVLIISIFNYFTFVHSNVWKIYIKEFDKSPKKKNKESGWIVFGITLIIIANVIFSFYLMSQINWQTNTSK